MDRCSFDEPWKNPKNVLAERSLLILEACTAACWLHLSRTWLIMQKSAQSVQTSLNSAQNIWEWLSDYRPFLLAKINLTIQSRDIIISLWRSVKVTAYFSTCWTCKQFLQTWNSWTFRGCCPLGVRNSLKRWTAKMVQSYWNNDFMSTQLFCILFSLKDMTSALVCVQSAVRMAKECWPAWETDVSSTEVCVSTFSWTLSACLRLWLDLYMQEYDTQHRQQILSIFLPLLPRERDHFIIIAWFSCLPQNWSL